MNEHVIAIQISQAILQITVGYITDIFVLDAHLWSFFLVLAVHTTEQFHKFLI